jgi:hypothetical protein
MATTRTAARVLVLASSALLCAVASGWVALAVHHANLSPTDAAAGLPLLEVLRDPFVFVIWASATSMCAVLGFGAALLTLWRANLGLAIPVVSVVTIGSAAATASVLVPMSAPVALVMGIATMALFRGRDAPLRLRAKPVAR